MIELIFDITKQFYYNKKGNNIIFLGEGVQYEF